MDSETLSSLFVQTPIVRTVVGNGKALSSLAWAPTGRKIIAGNSLGSIYVYDLSEVSCYHRIICPPPPTHTPLRRNAVLCVCDLTLHFFLLPISANGASRAAGMDKDGREGERSGRPNPRTRGRHHLSRDRLLLLFYSNCSCMHA